MIFEYFEKLEKSMVWGALQPLSKAHQSRMSKGKEYRVRAIVDLAPGGPALVTDPAGLAAAPSV